METNHLGTNSFELTIQFTIGFFACFWFNDVLLYKGMKILLGPEYTKRTYRKMKEKGKKERIKLIFRVEKGC
jgi:hypothetical protein